jgi:hypothetical protein
LSRLCYGGSGRQRRRWPRPLYDFDGADGSHPVGEYYSFNGTDGSNPRAALLQASDGALYGTTAQGGSTQCIPSYVECGAVFRLDVP